jgi:hypothetical protein
VAFRAVRLAAGTHLVEMVYRPKSLYVGLGVTAVTALALLGLAWPRTGRADAAGPSSGS